MTKKHLLIGALISTMSMTAFAKGNLYVSMQGGIGGMDTEQVALDATPYTSYSLRGGNAWRPAIGYLFDLSKGANLGLELGYSNYSNNNYGLINGATQTYKGHNIDLLAVGKLHFSSTNEGLYGVAKIGTAFVTQEFDGENTFGTIIRSYTYKAAPEIGIGLGYDFEQPIGIDVMVNRVFASQTNPQAAMALDDQVASVTTIMFGATFRFPST